MSKLNQKTEPLPTDLYPDSKDWVEGSYAERVRWLKSQYESVKAELARLEQQDDELARLLQESRANDQTAMAYLAEVRELVGGKDFPDMVQRVKALVHLKEHNVKKG